LKFGEYLFFSGAHFVVIAPSFCHFLKVTYSFARLERTAAATSSACCLPQALELSLPMVSHTGGPHSAFPLNEPSNKGPAK